MTYRLMTSTVTSRSEPYLSPVLDHFEDYPLAQTIDLLKRILRNRFVHLRNPGTVPILQPMRNQSDHAMLFIGTLSRPRT